MLPRDIRCRMISLLLGAVKIERDQHIVSHALYNLSFILPFYVTCPFGFPGPLVLVAEGVTPHQDHTAQVCKTLFKRSTKFAP